MPTDVWPDLDWSKAIRTPRTVLLEQSEVLKNKSKGALILSVITSSHAKNDQFPEGFFRYEAAIMSLRLTYSMLLLAVQHSISSPYPAMVLEAGENTEKQMASEEQFIDELRAILSKRRWIVAIDRLIAMGNSQ
jgi:hypothetical protein